MLCMLCMLVQYGSELESLSPGRSTQIAAMQPARSDDPEQSPGAGESVAEVAAHVQHMAASVVAMQEQLQQLSGQLANRAATAEAPGLQASVGVDQQLSSLLAEVSGLKGTRCCQPCQDHRPGSQTPRRSA